MIRPSRQTVSGQLLLIEIPAGGQSLRERQAEGIDGISTTAEQRFRILYAENRPMLRVYPMDLYSEDLKGLLSGESKSKNIRRHTGIGKH